MTSPSPPDPQTQPLATVDASAPGRPAPTPWSFVDVFAGLGAVLLLSILIAAPIQFSELRDNDALLVLSTLPVWIGLLGTTVWASRRHGTGNLVVDLALRIRGVDIWIGLGAGLGLRVVIAIWTVIYMQVTGQQPTGNLEPILGGGLGTGVWLVVNMTAIAVVGPVIEEIFFRGLGLRSALASTLRRAGSPRFADPRSRAGGRSWRRRRCSPCCTCPR